ncbi:hypothetical protein SAMN05421755_100829 [Nitrosomonas sp. Nm33]|nr:hypothetical protein SAMN05421755_100829 [Nitrosomonas sp. Nm33]
MLTVPPALDVPGAVQSYAFRLYFMPADRRWTEELFQLCSDTELLAEIDRGSEAWKILYVVTDYRSNSLVEELERYGLVRSHVEVLRGEGLTTTALVQQQFGVPTFSAMEARLAERSLDAHTRAVIEALHAWALRTTVRRGGYPPQV